MKIRFLYYKHLLDLVFIEFFEKFNGSFSRDCNGEYLFSSDISRTKLKNFFKKSLLEKIDSISKPWSSLEPSCLVLVGSCFPRDNIILKFRDEQEYFPVKLNTVLSEKPSLKWILRERGIKLDIQEINSILVALFDELLEKSTKHAGRFKNIMVVTHKHLDCYAIFKILKWMYGKSSSVNLYEEIGLASKNLPLVALNDIASRYIHNKATMNKSTEFKQYAEELKQYASGWMKGLFSI